MNFDVNVNVKTTGKEAIDALEKKIQSLKSTPVEIKVKTDGSSGISNFERQIKSLKNQTVNIKVGTDKLQLASQQTQYEKAGKNAGKSYATALQDQIKVQARTQQNYFSQQSQNWAKQQKDYSSWWNKELSKSTNKNYGKSQQEMSNENYLKNLQAQAQQVQQIKKSISQGFMDVDTSSVKRSLDKYSNMDSSSLKQAEQSYAKLISLQKELKSGTSNDSLGKTLSNGDMVSKWNQFSEVLQKCQNQMKVLSNEASGFADGKQLANFQKKVQSFYDSNSKMHKQYGQQVQSILSESMSADLSNGDFKQLQTKYAQVTRDISLNGLSGKSHLEEFGRAFKQIGEFVGIYGTLQNVVFDGTRQMVQAVKDVNAAQIELTKVSDAPTNQLKAYFDEASESAKKYGASISDVINSTADWSKLGYNLKDSKQLSDMTTLYQNVGDNMTQETASKSLVSTLQGFQLNATEAESIVDKFNEVGKLVA